MLRLESVSKHYGRRRQALIDVDLQVMSGDILAVRGDNGSGKSTMLRIIAGISLPTSGRIIRNAHVLGYVPESFSPHERLSAAAYLRHMGLIRGLDAAAARRRANELLDRLALVGGSGTPVRKLSKGNAQKVALAQALLAPPDLLVLDEPWSGLEAPVHGTLGELIAETAGRGGAVIFTDHRESVVHAQATRTCRVDQGRLQEVAAPALAAAPAQEDLMCTTLTTPLDGRAAPVELDWPGLTGVMDVERRPGLLTLWVRRRHLDALLVEAIGHGWSVVHVETVSEPPPQVSGTSR